MAKLFVISQSGKHRNNMARAANLQTLHNHYKTYVNGINFPNQLSEYEDSRQALQIAQERAYELVWFAEDHLTNPPEWYETENLWDTYAGLTGRDPEAELVYSTNKRKS